MQYKGNMELHGLMSCHGQQTHVVPWSTATSGAMATQQQPLGQWQHELQWQQQQLIEPISFNNQPDRSATNQGMQRQRYGTTWLKKAVLLLTFQFNNY
jgi:hypothetical protein